jgi:hypothetical protein
LNGIGYPIRGQENIITPDVVGVLWIVLDVRLMLVGTAWALRLMDDE